jgi:hypothetical protein
MFNMIEFAASQTPTTAPAAVLDFGVILVALGLAEQPHVEQPAAVIEDSIESSIIIEFDSELECESVSVERDGVTVRFMRGQQVWCTVTDSRGRHSFTARMTRVFFVNQMGGFIGETAILPIVDSQEVADALVWRAGVMPEGDIVTLR